jgi:DnaJ-class molecular chaperone
MAGEGGAGPAGSGDLYLVVSVRPHERFERRGDDLYTDVQVPLTDAVLGGEVQVQALTSTVMLKMPPLTQNGRSFRLSGLGMPRLGGTGKGDLYARATVKLPDELSEREKKLFEELRAARN